jgi:hypothetical protein
MQATVAALGTPTGFLLTPGPAGDREGAEALPYGPAGKRRWSWPIKATMPTSGCSHH